MKQHYYLLMLLICYSSSACSMDAKHPSRKARKRMWKTVRQTMANPASSHAELVAMQDTILQLIAAVASAGSNERIKYSRAKKELSAQLAPTSEGSRTPPPPLTSPVPQRVLPARQLPLIVVTEDRNPAYVPPTEPTQTGERVRSQSFRTIEAQEAQALTTAVVAAHDTGSTDRPQAPPLGTPTPSAEDLDGWVWIRIINRLTP